MGGDLISILTRISFPVFVDASRLDKAMVAHEKALEWQELFDLAVRNGASNDDMVSMGYRVAGMDPKLTKRTLNLILQTEDLCSKKRYAEAARVLVDYCEDIREALIALTSGNSFAEARRIACLLLFWIPLLCLMFMALIDHSPFCAGTDGRYCLSGSTGKQGADCGGHKRDERAT